MSRFVFIVLVLVVLILTLLLKSIEERKEMKSSQLESFSYVIFVSTKE